MNNSIRISLSLVVMVLMLGVAIAIPSSYLIPNVPYQRQVTKYNCGDASSQMVLEYWGRNISQLAIDDSARTSKSQGTSSYDIVRLAQFSILSHSVGTRKKHHESDDGYIGYPLGMNAAGYSSNTEWSEQLKTSIAMNIPVILLMHYSLEDPGGHFRVAIGYDDNTSTYTTLDPWDRGGQPRVFELSYSNFTALWNYTEHDSPRGTPFFGAIFWPLELEATATTNGNQTTITGSFFYGVPVPGLETLMEIPTPLSTLVSIETTELFEFMDNQPMSYSYNTITAGSTQTFEWTLECPVKCQGMSLNITAEMVITGNVPYTYDKNHINYPAYNYMDVIGNTITVDL